MLASNLLPDDAVKEFKKLYEQKFKQKLSDDEAKRRANYLFELYLAVYGNSRENSNK